MVKSKDKHRLLKILGRMLDLLEYLNIKSAANEYMEEYLNDDEYMASYINRYTALSETKKK